MTPPHINPVYLGGSPDMPTLVVGPSLGTSVSALWASVAAQLATTFQVIGWDLPGHGSSPPPVERFTIADLSRSVSDTIDSQTPHAPVTYAGVSVGGAVGLQMLLDRPSYFSSAALICTGAKIGEADDWRARAEHVCTRGTHTMIDGATQRWFAPGFQHRNPAVANTLLDGFRHTDKVGYALTCRALGQFDLRHRLGEIVTPVLAIAGTNDIVTPPELLRNISTRVAHGSYVELRDAAHLPPVEQPNLLAELIGAHAERNCQQ